MRPHATSVWGLKLLVYAVHTNVYSALCICMRIRSAVVKRFFFFAARAAHHHLWVWYELACCTSRRVHFRALVQGIVCVCSVSVCLSVCLSLFLSLSLSFSFFLSISLSLSLSVEWFYECVLELDFFFWQILASIWLLYTVGIDISYVVLIL